MRRSSVLTSVLLFVFSIGFGQTRVCDSLLHKSYEFLYDQADEIVLGKVEVLKNMTDKTLFSVKKLETYKGRAKYVQFLQADNNQWFQFNDTSHYVFLVFKTYQDPVFTPCILFGDPDRMLGIVEYAKSACKTDPLDLKCEYISEPVCGCDGLEYQNPCEAKRHGVRRWTAGRCDK